MKRIFFILFIAVSLSWIAYTRTDGFSFSLITGPLLSQSAPPIHSDTKRALSQTFHYLGKGRQSFVFESADGKYVLKFFNQKYFQMPWYSFFSEKKERVKRALRRHFYENSYEIAFREFGDEILYLHLGSSQELPIISIRDRPGREYIADLNQLPFVLQRKGIPFYQGLNAVYQQKGIKGLCEEIDAFLAAISHRIEKKIADRDSDVEHNWGYVDGHLFHLDPGRLYRDDQLVEPARVEMEWRTATRNFHKWLQNHYPDAAKYLENSLKEVSTR